MSPHGQPRHNIRRQGLHLGPHPHTNHDKEVVTQELEVLFLLADFLDWTFYEESEERVARPRRRLGCLKEAIA
jgi:hypothetical protein